MQHQPIPAQEYVKAQGRLCSQDSAPREVMRRNVKP